ncbi:MAG: Maf family nucleotide pyrophosphatase [Halieaceae bacterium]|nr:Maf family nucleotide pyrophosphatase [Halieaceae bacterium]
MKSRNRALVLASTSPYRRRLLERLRIPFTTARPDTDETPLPGEGAEELARRLAQAKSRSVARGRSGALVLGSDQTASIDGDLLHKPGGFDVAFDQLQRCSGRQVVFHTALSLCVDDRLIETVCVATTVEFRHLDDGEIERYLELDEPYDCAGSFRWEGIGISLFRALRSDDPTALEGLPLISVAAMLRSQGLDPLRRT